MRKRDIRSTFFPKIVQCFRDVLGIFVPKSRIFSQNKNFGAFLIGTFDWHDNGMMFCYSNYYNNFMK